MKNYSQFTKIQEARKPSKMVGSFFFSEEESLEKLQEFSSKLQDDLEISQAYQNLLELIRKKIKENEEIEYIPNEHFEAYQREWNEYNSQEIYDLDLLSFLVDSEIMDLQYEDDSEENRGS